MKITGLRLGQNDQHRVCRSSWTQDDQYSYKHRTGRFVEPDFFVKSEGFTGPIRKVEHIVANQTKTVNIGCLKELWRANN